MRSCCFDFPHFPSALAGEVCSGSGQHLKVSGILHGSAAYMCCTRKWTLHRWVLPTHRLHQIFETAQPFLSYHRKTSISVCKYSSPDPSVKNIQLFLWTLWSQQPPQALMPIWIDPWSHALTGLKCFLTVSLACCCQNLLLCSTHCKQLLLLLIFLRCSWIIQSNKQHQKSVNVLPWSDIEL